MLHSVFLKILNLFKVIMILFHWYSGGLLREKIGVNISNIFMVHIKGRTTTKFQSPICSFQPFQAIICQKQRWKCTSTAESTLHSGAYRRYRFDIFPWIFLFSRWDLGSVTKPTVEIIVNGQHKTQQKGVRCTSDISKRLVSQNFWIMVDSQDGKRVTIDIYLEGFTNNYVG